MPCFLFTYHAYGTWLPDRPDGYVHWREGQLPTDEALAQACQRKMRVAARTAARLDEAVQRILIEELQTAAKFQQLRLHAAATEVTHVHALFSWTDERTPQHVSDGVRESLSRRLNKEVAKRKWLTKGGSKRQVKDQEHFDYLRNVYLPSHGAWKWDEVRGLYK
jgi:REP element-mobilizing transposase RayT